MKVALLSSPQKVLLPSSLREVSGVRSPGARNGTSTQTGMGLEAKFVLRAAYRRRRNDVVH
jgi:hypothetical protein